MLTFSGPNSVFPNQGPKIQRPFQRRTLELISLVIRRPFKDHNHHGPAGVGLEIHSGLFQGPSSEVIHYFNQFSRNQVFQYSLDSSIGLYRRQSINLYVLGPIRPIQSSTVGIHSHSSISRWPELYWPDSDNTADDPSSRISLSVFHIYWPPFSTWGLFPQLLNILDLVLSLFSFTSIKLILIILIQSFSTFSLFLPCLSVDIGGDILC
ncbi:hypothetical protein O181_118775 [Austropuccinia psidii MF-1]|uniref:Uncharacterized protein n=1 Tax=Austropuccinia psidii MF-1 TaxID=1389203 RepID=A0A9Q3KCU5_9BASI|nr:hypothetical protein [Austropuccinia psidii MF-1]